MVVGDSREFAAEFELREITGDWYFGSMRFWLAGREYGKYAEWSNLAASVRAARQFLAASERRTRSDLDGIGAQDVWWRLYGRFLQNVSAPVGLSTPLADGSESWGDVTPYLLEEVGESSVRDVWSIVIVRRSDGADRVIVYDWASGSTTETILGSGVCDATVSAYCCEVETAAGKTFEPSR